jgi:hypothetical protein
MELLCTIKTGGQPLQSTSRSSRYPRLACSLSQVPSTGLGSVVNKTAVLLLCFRINSFRMRCCARHGRSLKLIATLWVKYDEPVRDCMGGDSGASEMLSGMTFELEKYADGRCPFRIGGDGVLENMIVGPGPSSVDTRVIGTGLLLNFGADACRDNGGRPDADEGREVDVGVLEPLPAARLLSETERFEADGGIVIAVSAGGDDILDGGDVLRLTSRGTLTSFSPVDFFETGGPRIESPWLRRRIIFFWRLLVNRALT